MNIIDCVHLQDLGFQIVFVIFTLQYQIHYFQYSKVKL